MLFVCFTYYEKGQIGYINVIYDSVTYLIDNLKSLLLILIVFSLSVFCVWVQFKNSERYTEIEGCILDINPLTLFLLISW